MADKSKVATNKVVAYIGTSDWRAISVADWDAVDVKGEDRMWSSHNGWQIPVDKFTDDEIAWIESQEDLVIKDVVIPDLEA